MNGWEALMSVVGTMVGLYLAYRPQWTLPRLRVSADTTGVTIGTGRPVSAAVPRPERVFDEWNERRPSRFRDPWTGQWRLDSIQHRSECFDDFCPCGK